MLDLLDRRTVGLVTVQPHDPAAGTNLQWESPEDTRILIHSIFLKLVADANAADRRMTIEASHGSVAFSQAPAPGNQVASETCVYRFAPCILGIDQLTDFGYQWAPISEHLYLERGHSLNTNLLGIQATDQISEITMRYYQSMPR